jgi:predicted ATPase/transcriptional regulator with XRE-family HTH domain
MDPVQLPAFGTLLQRYRKAAGLSQQALAERANLSTRGISDLERGLIRVPYRDTVASLADALQLSAEERGAFEASVARANSPRTAPQTTFPDTSASAPHLTLPAHILPVTLTSLLGRERDRAAVLALLRQDDVRLLTLTGPPGVGKTRLALAVATDLRAAFPDGVAFVSLGDMRDATLVAATLTRALGVNQDDGGKAPLPDALLTHLRDKRLLLLLDNFEQVAAAATRVVEVCAACPRVVALVTSRTALGVRGEQTYTVPPLALPDPAAPPDAATLGRSAAVQLFVRRVQDVKPGFALTADNAALVAALCRRLDGLPLAIELAAARTKMLPLPVLLTGLERRQDVLVNGPRDLPPRQRALRATLDWSHDLLDPAAQATFRRLAVFAGGFSTDAAIAICAVVGGETAGQQADPLAPDDVAAAIEALVDGHLLAPIEPNEAGDEDEANDGGEAADRNEEAPRLHMLATARAYALNRLSAAGEEGWMRRVHADHYLTFAEGAAAALVGPEQAAWFRRIEREYANLRAALQWIWEAQDVARGLRLAGALWYFWSVRGDLTEGRAWLERALTAAATTDGSAVPAGAHALACDGAAILAYGQADDARAATLLERALSLYEQAGDRAGRAAVLGRLGLVALIQGDDARAEALTGESLALRREVGDCGGAANALNTLGAVARRRGDYQRAFEMLYESLALKRALGDAWGVAYALNTLGVAAREQGRPEEAHALHEEALALFQAVRGAPGVADALHNMALVARDRGDDDRAAELAGESLRLRRDVGDRRGTAATLRTLAAIARDQGDMERAATLGAESLDLLQDSGDHAGLAAGLEGIAATCWARGRAAHAVRLYGRAGALRAERDTPLPPVERLHQDQVLAALRAALGDDHFCRAWASGRATPLDRIAMAPADVLISA